VNVAESAILKDGSEGQYISVGKYYRFYTPEGKIIGFGLNP
jgi:hypothetical protein